VWRNRGKTEKRERVAKLSGSFVCLFVFSDGMLLGLALLVALLDEMGESRTEVDTVRLTG
jgi:hypothetical protein